MRKSRSSDLQMIPAPSPACTLYALRDQHVLRAAPKGPPAKNRPAGPAGGKGSIGIRTRSLWGPKPRRNRPPTAAFSPPRLPSLGSGPRRL
jgi:hypothetical protein